LEVKPGDISNQFFLEHHQREIRTAVPRGRPYEWVIHQLCQCAKGTGYGVRDCVYDPKKNRFTMTYTSGNLKKETIILSFRQADGFMSGASKIAFLIEGFDFEANQTTIEFLAFPEPLTILLIPTGKKSGLTAQAAGEYNKEIMIHLPLEPQPARSAIPHASIIMLHFSEAQIRSIIAASMREIPNFTGFANLNGSLALEDSRVMTIVLGEIQKHHGYFIDMYGGKNSVVPVVAGTIPVPYKDVYAQISKNSDIASIKEQLEYFAAVAQKRTDMVIVAPANRAFISALKEALPVFRLNGIRLVYVSEIVNHPPEK
jgi:hypothetical protein